MTVVPVPGDRMLAHRSATATRLARGPAVPRVRSVIDGIEATCSKGLRTWRRGSCSVQRRDVIGARVEAGPAKADRRQLGSCSSRRGRRAYDQARIISTTRSAGSTAPRSGRSSSSRDFSVSSASSPSATTRQGHSPAMHRKNTRAQVMTTPVIMSRRPTSLVEILRHHRPRARAPSA